MTVESPYGDNMPMFPSFYGVRPTEERVERIVERLVDRADAALMGGRATQEQYDAWFKALDAWADGIETVPSCG